MTPARSGGQFLVWLAVFSCVLLASCSAPQQTTPTEAAQSAPSVTSPTAGSASVPTTTAPPSPAPTSAPEPSLVTGWQMLAPLPTPRTEVAVAELGGKIYVAGGYAADGSTLDVVEVYDPATDRWATVAALPAGRNHMSLAALSERLYAVGGYEGPISDSAAAVDVWAYDPAADRWEAVTPLPAPRAAHAVVATEGRLYVVGGVGPDAAATLVLEPGADEWTVLAPIPTEREHLAAAALDGRIYAIAGRAGGQNLETVEAYVIAEDRWETLPPLPTARSGLAAAVVGDQVAVIGGEAIDGSGRTFAEVELFDPASRQWAAAEAMPTARHGLGAAVIEGALYVIGGGPVAGLTVSGANERYVSAR